MKVKTLIPFLVLFIITAAVPKEPTATVIHEVIGTIPQDEIPFETAGAGDNPKAMVCLVYPEDLSEMPTATMSQSEARAFAYTVVWIALKKCDVTNHWEMNGPEHYTHTSSSSFKASAGQITKSRLFTGYAPTKKGCYQLYCKLIVPGGGGTANSGKCHYRIK